MGRSAQDSIISSVQHYLSESAYNYAIMLNGGWGTGKTFFVKKVLMPKMDEINPKQRGLYVSLYGLKSIDEVVSGVSMSIISQSIGTNSRLIGPAINTLKTLAKVYGECSTQLIGKISGELIAKTSEKHLANMLSNPDYSYYFIFDDLERCSMPVNEIFGYINGLLEQNNSKVIIIANEIEINVSKDSSASIYNRIKEKVIGQTIHFQPELSTIVPYIVDKIVDKYAKHDLNHVITEKICTIMNDEQYFNLRTLQSSLIFWNRVCDDFNKNVDNKIELPYDVLLESILKLSILYKVENLCQNFNGGDDWDYWKDRSSKHFVSFKFIVNYISDGEYSCTYMTKSLVNYAKAQKEKEHILDNDPLIRLKTFYEMEDTKATYELGMLFKKLKQGEYSVGVYPSILTTVYHLKEAGIEPTPVRDYFEIMKAKVAEECTIRIHSKPWDYAYEYYSEYLECMEELRIAQEEGMVSCKREDINSIFDTKNWGKEFYNYYKANRPDFHDTEGLFRLVDIEKCANTIEKCEVKDLSDFRQSLHRIFTEIHYPNDFDSLTKLQIYLKEKKYSSKVKMFNVNRLINEIDIFCGKFKNL